MLTLICATTIMFLCEKDFDREFPFEAEFSRKKMFVVLASKY